MEEAEKMPVVILSLHQKWWKKMAAGEKVLELRKTKPQCKAPFRVLVYVTGGVGIVGEFICPEVLEIKNFEEAERKSKVPAHDIHNYAAGIVRFHIYMTPPSPMQKMDFVLEYDLSYLAALVAA